ncbi:hypothetical protein [Halalkalibacter urbisdiaboli]|uniref:hypothetical protein n=1 Tax=Halalkalibacter urbisdiaboli TaxID=1960589 RepID=UPI000B442EA7|nr:hypothetical protein [Halalkalibacter urbisdiaboli]
MSLYKIGGKITLVTIVVFLIARFFLEEMDQWGTLLFLSYGILFLIVYFILATVYLMWGKKALAVFMVILLVIFIKWGMLLASIIFDLIF